MMSSWLAILVVSRLTVALTITEATLDFNTSYHDETVMYIPRSFEDVTAEITLVNPQSSCPECVNACDIRDPSILQGKVVLFDESQCDEVTSLLNIGRAGAVAAIILSVIDKPLSSNYDPSQVGIRVNKVCCDDMEDMMSDVFGCSIDSGTPVSAGIFMTTVTLRSSDWRNLYRSAAAVVMFSLVAVTWSRICFLALRAMLRKHRYRGPRLGPQTSKKTSVDVQTSAILLLLVAALLRLGQAIVNLLASGNISTPFIIVMIFWGVPFAVSTCAFLQLILYWAEIMQVSTAVMKQHVTAYKGRLRAMCSFLVVFQLSYDIIYAFKILGTNIIIFTMFHNLILSGGSLSLSLGLLHYGGKILKSLSSQSSVSSRRGDRTSLPTLPSAPATLTKPSGGGELRNNSTSSSSSVVGPSISSRAVADDRSSPRSQYSSVVPIRSGSSSVVPISGSSSTGASLRMSSARALKAVAGGGVSTRVSDEVSKMSARIKAPHKSPSTVGLRKLTKLIMGASLILFVVTFCGIVFTVLGTAYMPNTVWVPTKFVESSLFCSLLWVTLTALTPEKKKNSTDVHGAAGGNRHDNRGSSSHLSSSSAAVVGSSFRSGAAATS